MRGWRRKFSVLFMLLLGAAHAWPEPVPPGQLRGLWVDAYGPGFKTPGEVGRLIADARALNLNALFVQVVRRGDCYCARSSVPRTEDPEVPEGFDPLAHLITRAHEAGLQVHAWVITTALWGAPSPPKALKHVYNQHGPTALGRDNWLNVRVDGVTRAAKDVYLDPGHPAVADYLAELVSSLASHYDLDGVSLDRLRYPDFNLPGGSPSWGYNSVSLARFAAETGGSAYPAPDDPLWVQWRRRQVSNLMRRLYLEIKGVDPSLWVSAPTVAYGAPPESLAEYRDSHAYRVVLQDWVGWLREGFLDLNLPMNYKQAASPQEALWFEAWNRAAARLGARAGAQGGARGATAIATAIYLNDLPGTRGQLEETLAQAGVLGWVGYSYRLPDVQVNAGKWTQGEAIRALTALLTAPGAPFATPQPFGRPPTVALGALLGRVEVLGVSAGRTVELLRGGEVVDRTETDANGLYGFVVPFGANYRVRLKEGPALPVSLVAGQVTRAPPLGLAWHAVGAEDD